MLIFLKTIRLMNINRVKLHIKVEAVWQQVYRLCLQLSPTQRNYKQIFNKVENCIFTFTLSEKDVRLHKCKIKSLKTIGLQTSNSTTMLKIKLGLEFFKGT